MTACKYLSILVIAGVVAGWSTRAGADIKAALPPTTSASATTATTSTGATDANPATHPSTHHKKKRNSVAATPKTPAKKTAASTAAVASDTTSGTPSATGVSKRKKSHSKHLTASTSVPKTTPISMENSPGATTIYAPLNPATTLPSSPPPITVGKSAAVPPRTPIVISEPPPAPAHTGAGPEVETGPPVARHGDYDASAPAPDSRGVASYQIASALPVPAGLAAVGTYTPHPHVASPLDNFTFTNFTRHVRNIYPWKLNIFTTKFWIGEGSTPVSSTNNVASAWDEDWRSNNGGTDTPDDREGYMPAHHAARENPFYVALPFNDLAFPDKARRWLPAGWPRRPKDGKQVSACQHRWVEIKNAQGDVCYAQWEDVGPLNYSDAEYVFGDARPLGLGNDRAGLDVSPAVADYLDITGRNCMTRWRFVDDADVVPGRWLQYDEEALIFRAMHSLKEDPTHVLPIQRATAPIDDEEDLDATKKKLGAAKG